MVLTTDWQWINLARSFIVTPSQVDPTDLLPFWRKTRGMSLLSQSWEGIVVVLYRAFPLSLPGQSGLPFENLLQLWGLNWPEILSTGHRVFQNHTPGCHQTLPWTRRTWKVPEWKPGCRCPPAVVSDSGKEGHDIFLFQSCFARKNIKSFRGVEGRCSSQFQGWGRWEVQGGNHISRNENCNHISVLHKFLFTW